MDCDLETVWIAFNEEPIFGINGYWDGKKTLPFFDFDSKPVVTEFEQFLRDYSLPFPGFMMETVKGFHFIGFTPIGIDTWIQWALALDTDRQHIGYTLIRGYTTLRTGKKKGACPIYRGTFIPNKGEHLYYDYSQAHLQLYPVSDFIKDDYRNIRGMNPIRYPGGKPIMELYR